MADVFGDEWDSGYFAPLWQLAVWLHKCPDEAEAREAARRGELWVDDERKTDPDEMIWMETIGLTGTVIERRPLTASPGSRR